MAINVANLKPASLKAKNVATEEYVDSSVNESFATLAATEEARDGQIAVFYQTEAPTANIQFGDYWLDTNDSVRSVYRYENVNGGSSGTLSWRLNTSAIAKSLQYGYKADLAASAAQTTANSKITTFYQTSVPTATAIGDLWIDTDDGNKMYRAASIGANEIKAGEWVLAVAVVDVAGPIANANDAFAQQLGYTDYNAMVAAATLGQTIINGGYINTGLIDVNTINASMINTNNLIAQGIRSDTIISNDIYGANISGAFITGSVIKASFIDLSSTATLTSWKYFTSSTIPSAYVDNFAHNNDGSLVTTDAPTNYVRLLGSTSIITPNVVPVYYTNPKWPYNTLQTLNLYSIDVYAWNSYKVNTLRRAISRTLNLVFASGVTPVFFNLGVNSEDNYSRSFSFTFRICNDTYVLSGNTVHESASYMYISKNGSTIRSGSNIANTYRNDVSIYYDVPFGNTAIRLLVRSYWYTLYDDVNGYSWDYLRNQIKGYLLTSSGTVLGIEYENDSLPIIAHTSKSSTYGFKAYNPATGTRVSYSDEPVVDIPLLTFM